MLALLQAQWTYTGYDAYAHLAAETRLARMNSACGIFCPSRCPQWSAT
jgi:hypothetical protein